MKNKIKLVEKILMSKKVLYDAVQIYRFFSTKNKCCANISIATP